MSIESNPSVPESSYKELAEKKEYFATIMKEVEYLEGEMIQQMKEKIDEGAYDLIISDEGSGRIPTLIFRAVYRARNPDKDFDTLFINGARTNNDPGVESKANLLIKEYKKGKRHALIISEYVEQARALSNFAENFLYARLAKATMGLTDAPFEDVSVAVLRSAFDYPNARNVDIAKKYKSFFIGEIKPEVPELKSANEIARAMMGTEKKQDDNESGRIHPTRISDFDSEIVGLTREAIKLCAQNILKKVWGEDHDLKQLEVAEEA